MPNFDVNLDLKKVYILLKTRLKKTLVHNPALTMGKKVLDSCEKKARLHFQPKSLARLHFQPKSLVFIVDWGF